MERSLHTIIIMAAIVLSILGTSLFYVGRKLFKWLCIVLPNVNPKLFIIIPVIIALSYIISFLPVNPAFKKYFVWINFCFIGVVLYFLLLFLLSDAVLLTGKLLRLVPSPVPKNIVMITGCIIIAFVSGITFYGIYNGRQVKKAIYTVEIKKETSLEKLSVVMVADTHLGHLNGEKHLAKIIGSINALEPDIVAIAGDVFNDNFYAVQNPDASIHKLQSIKSTYGVYAVFGNHDGGDTYNEMRNFLERANVRLLQDEYVTIEDKFVILGRTESSPIGRQDVKRKAIDTNANISSLPVIVIDHNPANINEYGNEADLILCGHTHKGQVFPGNIVTNRIYEVDYGHYQKQNGTHVVVTSGAGLWGPPLRIGTNNEVVKIDVRFIKQ